MQKHQKWLHDEIQVWLSDGLISAQQADALRIRYPYSPSDVSWGRIILSSIGAILLGLGIILFFAYNWADMPKFAKLAVVFLSLLIAHGTGLFISAQNTDRPYLTESLHVLGTMLFGAGIWLVAQIYHIDEHYPNAFLIWGAGALLLGWAMPSIAQGLMAVLLIFLWGCFEVFDFRQANHSGAWIILLCVIPLAWQLRSRALLFVSLINFIALLCFSAFHVTDHLILSILFFTACLYLAAEKAASQTHFAESAPVFSVVGYCIYFVILYFLSFYKGGNWWKWLPNSVWEWFYFLLPLVAAAVTWLWALLGPRRTTLDGLQRWEVGLTLSSLVLVVLAYFGFGHNEKWLLGIFFNLLFLGHCLLFILVGAKTLNWQKVTIGCMLLSTLVLARFIDLFDSLLMRSLAFVVLGVILFAVGNFYSRQKKQLTQGMSSHA